MADLPNRSEHEGRMARNVGRVGRQALNDLFSAIGDPPDFNRLPPEFWVTLENLYAASVIPLLEAVFISGAEAVVAEIGVPIDVSILNARAREWASQYSYDLVRGITNTQRSLLQSSISDFFSRNMTLRDLETRLSREFGTVRADMIAVTETTRAGVAGERAVIDELKKMGVNTVQVWRSVSDGRVCPICAPRDGKKQGDGWEFFPPAHPRCRCFVTSEVIVAA